MSVLLLALLLTVLLLSLVGAAHWGPANHLEFATRVYRHRRTALRREQAELLEANRRAFFYGNIAADIINFKAFGGHYNHCHRWTIVEEMHGLAKTDAEHAFAFGYLSHLAADTIAHNHFVPYHLARYQRGGQLGHLYWEMNADRFIDERRWEIVYEIKCDRRMARLDALVNATVPRRALSMGTNKFLFNHVLLSSESRHWRSGLQNLQPLAGLRLTRTFLERFQRAAVARIELALSPRGLAKLVHVDTNGKQAQQAALAARKGLLERLALRREERESLFEQRAAVFLEGMQSPPPTNGAPHWEG
ncbi:MAG: zinc dependent phospholipase C family protein [Planctomycetes bacterium]|nr:zinc dependent phospholipase C family protein [Planctomycetota bacterium]